MDRFFDFAAVEINGRLFLRERTTAYHVSLCLQKRVVRERRPYGKPRTSHKIGYCSLRRQCLYPRLCFVTRRIPDTILVECRVYYQRGIKNVVPDVASIRKLDRISWERENPIWWVRHVGGDVGRVIAGSSFLIEVLKIGLASERVCVCANVRSERVGAKTILLERKQLLMFVYKGHCRDLLLHDSPRK